MYALSISEVEHIDLTAASADGSQIADLLSSYDKANAETAAKAASSQGPHGVEEGKEEEEEEVRFSCACERSALYKICASKKIGKK